MLVTIDFHGPFRVTAGTARPGVHDSVDIDNLLPASALKGVMRASAAELLPGAGDLVAAVFGSRSTPSPWAWGPVTFGHPDENTWIDEPPQVTTRTRMAVAPDSGTARTGSIVVGDEVWAHHARFCVDRYTRLPQQAYRGRRPLTEDDHHAVLACAAAGVHALGSGRRRGLGWVTCTPTSPAVDGTVIDRFETLAEEWQAHRA